MNQTERQEFKQHLRVLTYHHLLTALEYVGIVRSSGSLVDYNDAFFRQYRRVVRMVFGSIYRNFEEQELKDFIKARKQWIRDHVRTVSEAAIHSRSEFDRKYWQIHLEELSHIILGLDIILD